MLETVLLAAVSFGSVSFVSYWLGVRHQQHLTRRWAQRALTAERIAGILGQANSEIHQDLQFERVVRGGWQ